MLSLTAIRFGAASIMLTALAVCSWAADTAAPPKASSSQDLFPEVPDEGAESRLPGERFDFLRGDSSVGGVVEGAPSPKIGEYHGSRAIDLINRRRNWIYSTQSTPSFEVSAERAVGVRSADADSTSTDTGWAAEFFQDRGPGQARQLDDPFTIRIPGIQDHVLGQTHSLGIPRPADPLAPLQNIGVGASPPPRAAGGLTGPSELSGVPNSVRELLAIPGSVNPLAAGFDPINLRIDGTRQELNPTLPDPLPGNQAARSLDALLGQPVRSVSEGPPSFLDSFNTRMLGNSSLAPAVGPAPESSRPTERPLGFGQFPARKF
jgi:hypothetical protein